MAGNRVPHRRLSQIAETLGIPIEKFYDAGWRRQSALNEECAQLCRSIRTDEGRLAVLECLRRVLDREERQRG